MTRLMTWKKTSKMNKLVTKPYSRIDKFILSLLITLIVIHFDFWIDYQFRNLDELVVHKIALFQIGL